MQFGKLFWISGNAGQRSSFKHSIPHHTITYIILLGYSALSDPIRNTPPSVTEVDQDVDANKIVFSKTVITRTKL
jgi:hypothetical protein